MQHSFPPQRPRRFQSGWLGAVAAGVLACWCCGGRPSVADVPEADARELVRVEASVDRALEYLSAQ